MEYPPPHVHEMAYEQGATDNEGSVMLQWEEVPTYQDTDLDDGEEEDDYLEEYEPATGLEILRNLMAAFGFPTPHYRRKRWPHKLHFLPESTPINEDDEDFNRYSPILCTVHRLINWLKRRC
ncbi:uncharacterized protein LOC126355396 isoform X2 [Schistocerca gregaria]|uniref:uncharacterized protein LOC126355396 isoform X2 n=1 Tax=Schistocerca gregaria TaxID=7010 RepID=UPI00211F2FDE|nr:uncharacterized protein LOC126355396 isoform X2 [Schistocerca gregaria]